MITTTLSEIPGWKIVEVIGVFEGRTLDQVTQQLKFKNKGDFALIDMTHQMVFDDEAGYKKPVHYWYGTCVRIENLAENLAEKLAENLVENLAENLVESQNE